MELELVNITVEVVNQIIDGIIKSENACICPKCRVDAMALALNKLPPKYVVSEQGNAFASFQMSLQQNRVDIYKTVLEAVQRVKASPQH